MRAAGEGRFEGRRVYVTGATGFIGHYVVDALLADGAEVTALARRPNAEASRALAAKGVRVAEGNVTDPKTLDLSGHDLVIHAAAWVGFGVPRAKRALFRRTNVEGTRHVLEAARKAGVRKVVHVSSVAALGRASGVMHEDSKADRPPLSLYEETKRDAHAIALEYKDLDVALPMPGLVVGVGSDFDRLFALAARGKLSATLSGDATKGWVHVVDTAEGILLAALKGHGPYLLVSDNLTASEMCSRVARLGHAKPPRLKVPVRLVVGTGRVIERAFNLGGKTPPFSGELLDALAVPMEYSAAKARRELGWKPELWRHLQRDVDVYKRTP